MKRFSFVKFRADIDKNWIALLPTVIIFTDIPQYMCRNFSISVHFLVLHMSWLWLEEGR